MRAYLRRQRRSLRRLNCGVKNDDVGRDVAAFIDKVHHQWGGRHADVQGIVQVQEVRPFQSYGNWLHRLISGWDTSIEASIDLSVDGLPFEVRTIYGAGLGWRVRYFQSHAM